jgi:uncharacterized protein
LVKELLKTVIYDQQALHWKEGYLPRAIPEGTVESESVVVISGVRRCGKSTLIHQIRESRTERDYYLNFDDERLIAFTVEHFQLLQETFVELFGEQRIWYFDEIQSVPGWERFVRRLHDLGHKVFVTGSNATMLSRELGTHLTGRFIPLELFPFSFAEYLRFRKVPYSSRDRYKTESRAAILRHFNDFSVQGGFPTFLKDGQTSYLTALFESIIYRDVMVRNKLTNEKEILELVHYLASNTAKLSSYNALARISTLRHPTTIKNYLSFLEDAYLLFQVNKYDPSLRKQIQNPKKIYFIDNAIIRKVGFMFSEESGRLLENLIFVELRRRGHEVFYHHGRGECDFVLRQGMRISQAIQVCDRMENPETLERELAGLAEAMNAYDLPQGTLILRDAPEKQIDLGTGKTVRQVPAWKWILETEVN